MYEQSKKYLYQKYKKYLNKNFTGLLWKIKLVENLNYFKSLYMLNLCLKMNYHKRIIINKDHYHPRHLKPALSSGLMPLRFASGSTFIPP